MSEPPSIAAVRLGLCVRLRPDIPSDLPADLAAICADLQLEDRQPAVLTSRMEARILAAYEAQGARSTGDGAPSFARQLGRAAVQNLDPAAFAGTSATASPSAQARELRGALSEIPLRLEELAPTARIQVVFAAAERATVRLVAVDDRFPLALEFEAEYLQGMLECFVERCGFGPGVALSALETVGPGPAGQPTVVLDWSGVLAGSGGEARSSGSTEVAPSSGDPVAVGEEAVVRKSAELLKERKELLTAVEYLHLANNELERQIRMNKRELDMARNIQKGFVPRRIPDWKGLQFWVKFYPMAEVSGDFYDYFTLGSNKLGIMVCDVSGHGVPAALISAIAKLSFKSHNLDSPADVFREVNLDLLSYVKKEGYLTCFYMIINSQNEIVYSVGAAPPPMLLRAASGEVEKLAGKGTLLGMFPDAGKLYEDRATRLQPGDKLFIFTDGLTEARSRHDDFLEEAELIRVIKETREMDVQRACEHVMAFYDQFTLGRDADDDLTVITMMLSEREDEFNAMVREARKKHNDGQVSEACEILSEAIKIFPRHTPSLFLLGKYLFQARRFGEASDFLNQYNALKPYNADSYTILAECALLTNNVPLAVDHVKRSLSLRSENPGALYLAARIYDSVGRREEAIEAYRELEHLRPRDRRTAEIRDLLDI